MFRTNLRFVFWGALGFWAAAASAADPWQNAQIMPKSDQLLLRIGGEVAGDVHQIEWPATVERIEGQWLWIADRGGYHVPAISGWVSKDEVLKLAEAHDYYMDILQTYDAPWLHWLIGICLESRKESTPAEEEYLKCLSLNAESHDADAVRRAVEGQPNLLDAAVRLLRSQTLATNSVEQAVMAANVLKELAPNVEAAGYRRPYVHFERAEALRRAFGRNVAEEQKKLHEIEARIARANSEKNGGTDDDRSLFTEADETYQLSTSAYSAYAPTGPHCWKGHLGAAELHLSRGEILRDEAWSLIAAEGASPASPPADAESADNVDAAAPVDLQLLDVFVKRLSQQGPATANQAKAACVCLAAAVESLQKAVAHFDKAVGLSPDLVEAYRDRGLAFYRLAQCEAAWATIEDALRKLPSAIKGASSDQAAPTEKLDRALVDGRRSFEKALNHLVAAREQAALLAAERKDIASAEDAMAKNNIATALIRGDSAAHGREKAETAGPDKMDLSMVGKKLHKLRSDAAAINQRIDRDERKAAEALVVANAELAASCNTLNNSRNLQQAKRSAHAACGKGNYSSAESLKVLAMIYASQCNFDRAEFYQKLAVIFASEDERPAALQTLEHYRKLGQVVTERKQAKTPPSPPGQGRGSHQPAEEQATSE